jgi:hypothetical protein
MTTERASQGPDDRLMSVAQVARHYGVGVATIAKLVGSGTICSLDRGRLIGQGQFDVPLIRLSWAEAIRVDSPGASRRIDPDSEALRGAVQTAVDFHAAVDESDAEAMFRLSSAATRASGGEADTVAARWREAVGNVMNSGTGVATGAYSLAPLQAIAMRVVYDAPAIPTVYTKPTPLFAATLLPLVPEDGEWRVDFDLWQQQEMMQSLLGQPLPEGA